MFWLQDGANIVKKMKGVFCFRVKGKDGKEGIWIVDAKNGNGSVSFGGPGKVQRHSVYKTCFCHMRTAKVQISLQAYQV